MTDSFSNPALEKFEIKVENHLADHFHGALGFGAPLPPNAKDGDGFHLEDESGENFPLEWRPLIGNKDGASWAYFTFPTNLYRRQFQHLKVKAGALSEYSRLELEEANDAILIQNGDEEIIFHKSASLGLQSLRRNGVEILSVARDVEMDFGNEFRVREPLALSLHTQNSFEIVVRAEGCASDENGDGIYLRILYKIRLGQAGLDVNVLFSNRRASDDELLLQRLAISFGLASKVESCHVRQNSSDCLCLPRDNKLPNGVEIKNGVLSDSSHLNFPSEEELWPFFKRLNKNFFARVAPYVGVELQNGGAVWAWSRAASLETNSFSCAENIATLELVSPGEGKRVPQGFSRSFDFSISTFSGSTDGEAAYRMAARGEYTPLVSVHPDWFIENRIEKMDELLPYQPQKFPRFERLLWREFAKGYFSGFYHSGDYPTSRGDAQALASATNYTWNNNEEDHLKGIAWMLMRTGDPSYMEDLRVCGRHLLEVDRVAHSSHALQAGVLIAHAPAHFDGAGYPSHCWAEGILLYYKLTGEEDALDAFLKLCDCLLAWCDVPEKLRFSDGREMGVPITNFAHAFKITGDEKYHDAAQMYIAHLKKQMREDGCLFYDKGGIWSFYAEYVAVEGLWDWHQLVSKDDVKDVLLEIIAWICRDGLDTFGVYDARAGNQSFLHIFYIAYRLTNDEAWLEKGRVALDAALSQSCGLPLLKFGNNGAFYHEAAKRGWMRDDVVPLDPSPNFRAVGRQYGEPMFVWERKGAAPLTSSL